LTQNSRIQARSEFLDTHCNVGIERENLGQRDRGNSAFESNKLKQILIGSLNAF